MTASTTLVAVVATTLGIAAVLTDPVAAHTFSDGSCLAFSGQRQRLSEGAPSHHEYTTSQLFMRGGATGVENKNQIDEDEDEDEMELESSEEEEELDPKLAKSTLSAASKRKAKAAGAVKAAVSSKLQGETTGSAAPKKKSNSILKLLKIPYIVRACLNPLLLVKMTKGYFASLFDFGYLENNKVSTVIVFDMLFIRALQVICTHIVEILTGGFTRFEERSAGQGKEGSNRRFERKAKDETWPGQDAFGSSSAKHLRLKKGIFETVWGWSRLNMLVLFLLVRNPSWYSV